MRERESTIPAKNVGRCPQGGCQERHSLERIVAGLEVKFWFIMGGVGAVLAELTLIIFRAAGI